MITCLKCGNELKSSAEIAFEKMTTALFRKSSGIKVYDIDGQTVFPVYSIDGLISARNLFYLWRPNDKNEMECVALWVSNYMERDILHVINNWEAIKKIVKEGDPMGLPSDLSWI